MQGKSPIDTLVISPHIDDEVLGCFSFLGPQTLVLYCGVEDRPNISAKHRVSELERVADYAGFSWKLLSNSVNRYEASSMIGDFETAINELQPHTVLFSEPSYNQDHRAVYEAAMIATRPHDINWSVSRVLLYEQPHSVIWPTTSQTTPGFFMPVDIDRKVAAYELYRSQVRQHRSVETLRALAALRGSHVGVPFAEAFHVKRIVASPADKADQAAGP